MSQKIFISYRREDSRGDAGRIADRLTTAFGKDNVFIDVDAIGLGVNFVKALQQEVAKCDVLLAIIGPRWLDAKDDDGTRRLDNPNDFVRIEIAAALARDIPVVPVLLDGTRIPKISVLPPNLAELSQRNGIDVRHASFHPDVDKLIRGLRGLFGADSSPSAPRPVLASPDQSAFPTPAPVAPTVSIQAPRTIPLMIVPTADEVIAAKGKWVKELHIKTSSAKAPQEFNHYFIRTAGPRGNETYQTAGTVLVGHLWDKSDYPLWRPIHGWCGSNVVSASFGLLTYLGPTWCPEYAQLSDEVFQRLGGKPLKEFVRHP